MNVYIYLSTSVGSVRRGVAEGGTLVVNINTTRSVPTLKSACNARNEGLSATKRTVAGRNEAAASAMGQKSETAKWSGGEGYQGIR